MSSTYLCANTFNFFGMHRLICVIIDSFKFSANCAPDSYVCTAWTGLNDLHIEGQYKWDHSNTLLTFINWHPEEPSLGSPSRASDRDCIDMLSNGLWNDRPCSYPNSVICEKSFKNWMNWKQIMYVYFYEKKIVVKKHWTKGLCAALCILKSY